MSTYYVLAGHDPVAVDLDTWARWFESTDRHVAQDQVGDARVSTVFMGLDHSFGVGAPVLFETMVFGGPLEGEHERYATWDEAEAGHKATCQRVRDASHD